MTRRRKLLLPLAALALGLVVVLLIRNREPRYQGRTISEWADLGLKATDTVPWDEPNVLLASNALRQIGDPAFASRVSMDASQYDLVMRAARLAGKLGPLGKMIAEWLATDTHKDMVVHIDRSGFIDYSLATATNAFLPRLLDDAYSHLAVIAAALDEPHAPMLADVFLNQTNRAGKNALMVLDFMGSRASSADPILRPFIETNRSHPNWEAAMWIIARAGLHQEDTAQKIVGDARLATNTKLAMLAWTGEPGIRATASFLTDTDPAIGGGALLQLLLQTEERERWERELKPTFRLSQNSGRPSPLEFPNGWRPSPDVVGVLQQSDVKTRLAAIAAAADLMVWDDATLEKAAWRYSDIDAGYRHHAIQAFTEALAKDPDPQVSQAAAMALEGFRLPKER